MHKMTESKGFGKGNDDLFRKINSENIKRRVERAKKESQESGEKLAGYAENIESNKET